MPYGAFFYAQYLILTRKEQKKPPKVGKPRGACRCELAQGGKASLEASTKREGS